MTAPRFTAHCPQGQKLPANWQTIAKQRAMDAESQYKAAMENAWRSEPNTDTNIMRAARLQPPRWEDLFGQR